MKSGKLDFPESRPGLCGTTALTTPDLNEILTLNKGWLIIVVHKICNKKIGSYTISYQEHTCKMFTNNHLPLPW